MRLISEVNLSKPHTNIVMINDKFVQTLSLEDVGYTLSAINFINTLLLLQSKFSFDLKNVRSY